MASYLFRVSYTQQGIQGLRKEGGSGRAKAVEDLVASAGGRVVCQYWAFGDTDYFGIVEVPDHAAAASIAATVGASGAASLSTTVLLTAADMDEAMGRSVSYRAPGA